MTNTPPPERRRAVVLGASMAGLCAARVLADHFEQVLVLDRDELPAEAGARARVPQGRQPHLLLAAGSRLLEGWFPGLTAELAAAGAVELDLCADFHWYQAGWQRQPDSGLRGPSMSRPLLEHAVRRRAAGLPNVTIRDGCTVTGLILDVGGDRVTSVRLDAGATEPADLIIDATGRQARSLRWLEAHGYAAPPTTVVDVATTYVSRRLQRLPGPARGWKATAYVGDPASCRLGMALPMEDDQWHVLLAGVNGEAAPTDEVGMIAYARTFDSPEIADLLQESPPTTPITTHRFPANQRRHVEKLRRFPLGWLLLGDAVASFDPIYGQGITSAALQAAALDGSLRRTKSLDRRFSRSYFKAAAKAVAAPWSMAVGGDFAYAATTGPKPAGTDLLNRYTDRIVRAGQVDDAVVIRFNEVISLVRSPNSLLAPAFVLRVLTSARRAGRPLDAQPSSCDQLSG